MYLFVNVISLLGCCKKFFKVCLPKFLGFFFCPFLFGGTMVLDSEIHEYVSELPLTHEGNIVVDVNEIFKEFIRVIHCNLPSSLFLDLVPDIFGNVALMIAWLTINFTRTLTVL
jgi:hypothetical protein